jgi:hypothetical protein
MEDDASITLGPLKIWISQRQFPDHHDYWDGNWVAVTALCEGVGSRIEVSGSFLHLGELKKWKEDLEAFQRTLKGSVELPTIEPTLAIKIEEQKSKTGHLNCEVQLTGEQMSEFHRYTFDIDQSYLPGLLGQLAAVLREFPIRNEKIG